MAWPFFGILHRGNAENSLSHPSHGGAPKQRLSLADWRLLYALLYLLALIFLILVEIGNVSDKPVLRETYLINIDLSEVIPRSVPDAALINSIARTIGLHDFYQVGLWNFCEGYNDGSGITYCLRPKRMYFFNPVEILLNELLSGATIALPSEISQALNLARIASHWMFALFLTAAVLTFICIFLVPLLLTTNRQSSRSSSSSSSSSPAKKRSDPSDRRYLVPLTLLTLTTFLATLSASAIATALFVIFKVVFEKNKADLNIHAQLGVGMLTFMWIAVWLTAVGFISNAATLWACCCCCRGATQRRHGAKVGAKGSEKAMFAQRENLWSSRDGLRVGEETSGDTRRRFHGWRRMRVGI